MCWAAYDHYTVTDITSYYCAGADDSGLANSDTWQDRCPRADECEVIDNDFTG